MTADRPNLAPIPLPEHRKRKQYEAYVDDDGIMWGPNACARCDKYRAMEGVGYALDETEDAVAAATEELRGELAVRDSIIERLTESWVPSGNVWNLWCDPHQDREPEPHVA